jgi:hypothetical protein
MLSISKKKKNPVSCLHREQLGPPPSLCGTDWRERTGLGSQPNRTRPEAIWASFMFSFCWTSSLPRKLTNAMLLRLHAQCDAELCSTCNLSTSCTLPNSFRGILWTSTISQLSRSNLFLITGENRQLSINRTDVRTVYSCKLINICFAVYWNNLKATYILLGWKLHFPRKWQLGNGDQWLPSKQMCVWTGVRFPWSLFFFWFTSNLQMTHEDVRGCNLKQRTSTSTLEIDRRCRRSERRIHLPMLNFHAEFPFLTSPTHRVSFIYAARHRFSLGSFDLSTVWTANPRLISCRQCEAARHLLYVNARARFDVWKARIQINHAWLSFGVLLYW